MGLDVTLEIENGKAVPLLGLEHPIQITASVARKLEKEFSLMAPLSDVPDVTRQEVTVGARHPS